VSTRCHEGIARERRVNRYYNPTTGQFLSVDPPVGETGQPYAYTGNDPLNATDPLGLDGCDCRLEASIRKTLQGRRMLVRVLNRIQRLTQSKPIMELIERMIRLG
jgi:uncharacterized protein RhaS with RHS repeats